MLTILFIVDVKNTLTYSYASTPPYAFMAQWLIS
jgi:hypothetical protein